MGYWEDIENLPADEYARRFKHFSPATVRNAMRARGLDRPCADDAVLRGAAKIHAAAIVAAEREKPGPPAC